MWLLSDRELKEAYDRGYVAPVICVLENGRTPQDIYRKLGGRSGSALLASPPGDEGSPHRYSYICFDPLLQVEFSGRRSVRRWRDGRTEEREGFCLDEMRKLLGEFRGRRWPGVDFFSGGALTALSYELASQFETLPRPRGSGHAVPEMMLALFDRLVAVDPRTNRLYVIQNICRDGGQSFEKAIAEAQRNIFLVIGKLSAEWPESTSLEISNICAETSQDEFERMVKRAQDYVAAGDIYQANLSQRFSFRVLGDAFELYRRLFSINPSPFAAFVCFGAHTLVSASPERLVRLSGTRCATRPIAGTRPRGHGAEEEARMKNELILNEKERAEHLMLVDLERNDLGRVCRAGSVKVDEWMRVETYSHVHHIVSNVTGELQPGTDRFDLVQAMFPGGTITGCPKIRCMEIIHELEGRNREWYTGSLGYFDFNGDVDLNILIRTIAIRGVEGSFCAGAGIVADSDASFEYEETLHKARALLAALGCAEPVSGIEPNIAYTEGPPEVLQHA